MKTYFKKEGDKLLKKTLKEIVIRKDGRVTYNPTEEMVLADGWVEYVAPEPQPIPEEVLIERAKSRKIDEINKYDSSKEVNICYIKTSLDTIPYWASKTARSSLKSAVQDYMTLGREVYRLDLREVGISVEVKCSDLLSMLSALEVYAIDCYNKTTDHIFAVNNLTTKEEVEAYDHRSGYPEKLTFNL